MAAKTEAQEEFDNILSNAKGSSNRHPEDEHNSYELDEADEETRYKQGQVEETMRMPVLDRVSGGASTYKLPDQSFDSGRTTGVKGVIADARSYEQAKREVARRSKYGNNKKETGRVDGGATAYQREKRRGMSYLDEDSGEDGEFLERWREDRRRELQREGNDIRNRRTSPSVRRFGRFDEVDALGYLDAIEKVGRETVVVVLVYDHECPVSQVIEAALAPLVPLHPAIHFVKVHYEDIEFDNAGVPAILAYKNQGDLFANLTYIIDQIPDETLFDTQALKEVLRKHDVL